MWACPAERASAGRAFRSVAAAVKRRQATRLQSLTQKLQTADLLELKLIPGRTLEFSTFSGQISFLSVTGVLCVLSVKISGKGGGLPPDPNSPGFLVSLFAQQNRKEEQRIASP